MQGTDVADNLDTRTPAVPRLNAALRSVVTSGPPIPRRDFSHAKTTINYTDAEVRGIAERVLEGVREKSRVPLTLLAVMAASKQVDRTQALWFDMCITVFDVQAVIVREVEISVAVPYQGKLFVTRCNLTNRNTEQWGFPDSHDTTPLAPFRQAGT